MPDDKISAGSLSREEKKIMGQDIEMISGFKDYRRQFETQMLRGAKVWNMIAEPSPRDDISNIFIGIARMVGSQAIAAMTAGRPFFGFRPGASSDFAKIPLWQAGIDNILDISNYDAKQQLFFVDHTITGLGILEVVPQMPMRKVRFRNEKGGFNEMYKRDYRRSKVEVRHRSPFEVWLDPCAPNLQEVTKVYDEMVIGKSRWEQDYKEALLPDGSKKYMHTELVRPG